MLRPLDPVTSKQRAAYGFAFFVLFVALWAWATFGGHVSKTFLANPWTMLHEGFDLLVSHGFLFDIGMTIWRVVGGFLLAALVAVPLGVLMGAYKPVEAFLEPFVSFARYLIKSSSPGVHSVIPDENFRHFVRAGGATVCPQLGVLEIEGSLYFGAVHHVEEAIRANQDAHRASTSCCCART